MADKSKFAALAGLRASAPDTHQPEELPAASVQTVQPTERGRGRPATGKRSDPAYKLYSHYLRRETQRAAATRLLAEDNGRDLSDVLQDLLAGWLKS
jgi:hypothetical protein